MSEIQLQQNTQTSGFDLANIQTSTRNLLLLGVPIVIGLLTRTGLGVVDSITVGNLSSTHLAAIGLGSALWLTLFYIVTGILMMASPIIGYRSAYSDNTDPVTQSMRQYLWTGLFLGIAMLVVLRNAGPILSALNLDSEVSVICSEYLQTVSWGMPFACLFYALRYCSEGLELVKVPMWIGLAGFIVNIPLNYWFVYGGMGVPELGAVGTGYATTLVFTLMFLLMTSYFVFSKDLSKYRVFSSISAPSKEGQTLIFSKGTPVGTSIFMESAVFSLMIFLAGSMGVAAIAGHQIAINIVGLTFVIPLGLSFAISIKVSQALGQGDKTAAQNYLYAGLFLCVAAALVFIALIGLFRENMAAIYTDNQTVIHLASSLLLLAALFQVGDSIQASLAGALRGYQDTTVPMIIVCGSYWLIALPLAWVLGLTDWVVSAQGVVGLWIGLLAGISVVAVALFWRYRYIVRHSMEPEAAS